MICFRFDLIKTAFDLYKWHVRRVNFGTRGQINGTNHEAIAPPTNITQKTTHEFSGMLGYVDLCFLFFVFYLVLILQFTVKQLTNHTITRIHYTTIHYTRLPKKCICINIGKNRTNQKTKTPRILPPPPPQKKKTAVVLVGGRVSICCHGSEVYYYFFAGKRSI